MKLKKCRTCSLEFTQFSSLNPYCSIACASKNKKLAGKERKPIKKISDKEKLRLAEYHRIRLKFLSLPENKNCRVYPNLSATEIHHIKGRIGSLLTDTDNFLPVSRSGHRWIHENPLEARELNFL